MQLIVPNGNIIWFKSGEDPDNLYGEDVQAAVMDEASRARTEAYYAVRSTLTATNGPMRFIGNVKGRHNWFYDIARRAEKGECEYGYYRIVAQDAVDSGVLSKKEIEQAKRDLPENVFKELYLAEPADDGGNPFGGDRVIADCVQPMSGLPPVVWGWDLAKSVDWTVGVALDKDKRMCRFERWQLPWNESINRIKSLTGSTPALVDSTGLGDPILEMLQKTPGSHYEGYTFGSSSKQKLMEGLAVALQQRLVTIPKMPDGSKHTMQLELEIFEYVYTRTGVRYSAPEGYHDDCVCALALAIEGHSRCKMPMIIPNNVLNRSVSRGQGLFR